MSIIAVIVAILVAVSGTTAVVAESSLPGDMLYPMKVTVNENVRAGLTWTSQGRAEWDVRRVERRLEEIEERIRESALTPEMSDSADMYFRSHIEAAKRKIDSLRKSGNVTASAEVSTELEGTLQAYAAMFSRITTRNADTRDALKNLLGSIKNESRIIGRLANEAAETVVAGSSSGNGMRFAAEATMKSAENKITEVRSFIDAKTSDATVESVAQANAQLQVAQSSLDSAQTAWNAGAYADAFQLVRTSLREAQEAKLLLDRSGSKENDSRSSASSSSAMHSSKSSTNRSESESEESKDNSDVNIRTEADARINAATRKIDEVRANVGARETKLSVTVTAQAIAKLDAAAGILSEARAKFGLSLYAEAKVMADISFQMAIDVQTQVEKETHAESSGVTSTSSNSSVSSGQ